MAAHRQMRIDAEERLLRDAAAVPMACLLAAGRDAEAREIAEEIRKLLPGDKTEEVLAKRASAAGHAVP